MNLNIFLNKGISNVEIVESYDDDLIGMLDQVCGQIDNNILAYFSVTIQGTPISKRIDFSYDFASIVSELYPLHVFLKDKNDETFSLNFYELSIMFLIRFTPNKEQLTVQLITEKEEDTNYSYTFDPSVLDDEINTCLRMFESILSKYFPLAYKIFKSEDYLPNGRW